MVLGRNRKKKADAESAEETKETIATARDWTQATLEKTKLPNMQIGVMMVENNMVEVEIDEDIPPETSKRAIRKSLKKKASTSSSPPPPPPGLPPTSPASPTSRKTRRGSFSSRSQSKNKKLGSHPAPEPKTSRNKGAQAKKSSKPAETKTKRTGSQTSKNRRNSKSNNSNKSSEPESTVPDSAETETTSASNNNSNNNEKTFELNRTVSSTSSKSRGSLVGAMFGSRRDPRQNLPNSPTQKSKKLTRKEKKQEAIAKAIESKKRMDQLQQQQAPSTLSKPTEERELEQPLQEPPTDQATESSSLTKGNSIIEPSIEITPSLALAPSLSSKKSNLSWQDPENSLLESMATLSYSESALQNGAVNEVSPGGKQQSPLYTAPSLQERGSEDSRNSAGSIRRKMSALQQLDEDEDEYSQGYLEKLEKRSPDYFFDDDEYMEKLEKGRFPEMRRSSNAGTKDPTSPENSDWEYTDDDEDETSLDTDEESALAAENHSYMYDLTENIVPDMMRVPSDLLKQMNIPNMKMPEIEKMELPKMMQMCSAPPTSGTWDGASSPTPRIAPVVEGAQDFAYEENSITDEEVDIRDDVSWKEQAEHEDSEENIREEIEDGDISEEEEEEEEEDESTDNDLDDDDNDDEEAFTDDFEDREEGVDVPIFIESPKVEEAAETEPSPAAEESVAPEATKATVLDPNDDSGLSDLEGRMSASFSGDEGQPNWLGNAYLSSSGSQGATDSDERGNAIVSSKEWESGSNPKEWKHDFSGSFSLKPDIEPFSFPRERPPVPQPKLHPTIRVVGAPASKSVPNTKNGMDSSSEASTSKQKKLKTNTQKKAGNPTTARSRISSKRAPKKGLTVYEPTNSTGVSSPRGTPITTTSKSRNTRALPSKSSNRPAPSPNKSVRENSVSSRSMHNSSQRAHQGPFFQAEEERAPPAEWREEEDARAEPMHLSHTVVPRSLEDPMYYSLEL